MALTFDKLIDTKRELEGDWFTFNETSFQVRIAYYGKKAMEELYNSCKVKRIDPRSPRNFIEEIDTNAFKSAYAERIVKDWKGLTLKVLRKLVVVNQDAGADNDELPFSPDNRFALISASTEFDSWVTSICQDVEVYNKAKKEEALKNSSAAPAGS